MCRRTGLRTTGRMSMARVKCLRDSTSRLNQTWTRLLANGVVRDIRRDEGAGMKHLTARWEKTWRKRNIEWVYKVRFVGPEYKWLEFREDPFAPGASYCTGRIVDIVSLKRRVPTFTLDCTDAFRRTTGGVFESFAGSWKVHQHLVDLCNNNCLVVAKLDNDQLITSHLLWWTSWVSRGV